MATKNVSRSIARIADEAAREALNGCLNRIIALAAVQHPKSRSGTAVRAYLNAVRARLEWQEERIARSG